MLVILLLEAPHSPGEVLSPGLVQKFHIQENSTRTQRLDSVIRDAL